MARKRSQSLAHAIRAGSSPDLESFGLLDTSHHAPTRATILAAPAEYAPLIAACIEVSPARRVYGLAMLAAMGDETAATLFMSETSDGPKWLSALEALWKLAPKRVNGHALAATLESAALEPGTWIGAFRVLIDALGADALGAEVIDMVLALGRDDRVVRSPDYVQVLRAVALTRHAERRRRIADEVIRLIRDEDVHTVAALSTLMTAGGHPEEAAMLSSLADETKNAELVRFIQLRLELLASARGP
jgi:hypothetical protein